MTPAIGWGQEMAMAQPGRGKRKKQLPIPTYPGKTGRQKCRKYDERNDFTKEEEKN
jgi:hypothetical protein